MGRMEDTELYIRACRFSDQVFVVVARWPDFARITFGSQLVRSLDSVGANLVEGDGRGWGADALRFFRIARASCREMRHWIHRAHARNLMDDQLASSWINEATELVGMINGLIRFRQENPKLVKESSAIYDDPFIH